jgi:hypothetical protein
MDGFYPSIKNQIEINVTVYNLIFAHQWGAFYKKDKSQPGAVLGNCLNMISTSPSFSAYDFSLKVWAQSLKTLYYPDRDDWLENIFDSVTYQNLSENQKGSIVILSLCSSIDELDNLEKGGKDKSEIISRQKNRIRKLYDDFTSVYNRISSPFIKFWGLQTLLFLRLQQINHSRFQDLSIQENLDNIFNDIHYIFKSSPNPLEKALALDFILSSRNPTHIEKALQATFDLIDNNPHDQLLLSLLIDVFGRIDLEIITNNNPQQQDPKFAEFYKDPFAYMCSHFHFDNSNIDRDGQLVSIEENWVCSAILRLEKSASAYKYFLPSIDTTPCKSSSYNHTIGDYIGGKGIRYNLPSKYKTSGNDNDWWIWRCKDNDGDIFTLYSCQIEEGLTISRFVNEYSPKDSGFILFNNRDFSDGLYIYNSHERPFWGGLWTIEDESNLL